MQEFTLTGKHTSSPPRPPSCRSLVYSQAALYFHPPCPWISSLWASPPLFFFSILITIISSPFLFFLFTDFLHPLSLSYFIWLRKTSSPKLKYKFFFLKKPDSIGLLDLCVQRRAGRPLTVMQIQKESDQRKAITFMDGGVN